MLENPPVLTLALFMARIVADYVNTALAADHLAMLADAPDTCSDFHRNALYRFG
jgi:hypothetical protein